MNIRNEWKTLTLLTAVFLAAYFVPVGSERFGQAVGQSLVLLQSYAREHVLLCLIPAFFIAGAIAVFVSQAGVMKYLGAGTNKVLAYGVASVSGAVLAVCSCTVLPLFAGIYRMGAGLGPATAFLYSGPAINVLAVTLTATVMGPALGIARAVGAIVFSIVIGLLMHLIYRREEAQKAIEQAQMPQPQADRPLWQNAVFFASMVGILVFANWSKPEASGGAWGAIHSAKWPITAGLGGVLAIVLWRWFHLAWWKLLSVAALTGVLAVAFPGRPIIAFVVAVGGLSVITATDKGQAGGWLDSTWGFAKQILPLLFAGVLVAGFLLGSPGAEGIIPSGWIASAVGGNSLRANLFAAVAGALMYFATLTEVPILQGLINAGMGKGPALALLLAGPALSLPNMLVIRSVIGTQKTLVYVMLVVVMATISGVLFGAWFG